jgi:uncharacterized protein
MGTRIVLDTNVFISALGWKGWEHKIFGECLNGAFTLCISKEILQELTKVLNYPKFRFTLEEKIEYIEIITEVAIIVEPKERIDIINAHPPDNKFLECAQESGALFIITGDEHLLNLKEYKGIRILRAPELLNEH